MILNAFAVLDGFLTGIRILLSLLVLVVAVWGWRDAARAVRPEDRESLDERSHLLTLLVLVLLGLTVVSWPLFYRLLQSYVIEWPGAMCIFGVTRVGLGSYGTARFLPGLIDLLEISKPWLVFVGGVWFVLHRIDRRSRTGALRRTLLAALAVWGLSSLVDGTAEAAYLVIPKKESQPDAGCCATAFEALYRQSRFIPTARFGDAGRRVLGAAHLASLVLMAAALMAASRSRPAPSRPLLIALAIGAAGTLLGGLLFMVEVAAPALLRLPHHLCPYDLLAGVPESLVWLGLVVAGAFLTGWSLAAHELGRIPGSHEVVDDGIRWMLRLGALAFAGAFVLMAVALGISS